MRDKSRAKVNITLRIAAVMLVLVLISASMISGMYARFTTTAYGEDSARVAKWNVQIESTDRALTFDGSKYNGAYEEQTYIFTVKNDSEVALNYSINISFGTPLPEHVKIKLDDSDWQEGNGKTTNFSFTRVYENSLTDSKENEHTLTIQVEYASESGKAYEFSNANDISVTISVTAEQIN